MLCVSCWSGVVFDLVQYAGCCAAPSVCGSVWVGSSVSDCPQDHCCVSCCPLCLLVPCRRCAPVAMSSQSHCPGCHVCRSHTACYGCYRPHATLFMSAVAHLVASTVLSSHRAVVCPSPAPPVMPPVTCVGGCSVVEIT